MNQPFTVAPRYRLDDESQWLRGIDPSRRYWLWLNGETTMKTALAGFLANDLTAWKQTLQRFRNLQPQEQMSVERLGATAFTLHCISANCYAIATTYQGAAVWHLFDQETLQSLLHTAHPDWQCAPQDVELGRELLATSLNLSVAA
ncbi:MAG: hypothetical protein AAGG51_14100 [Cyanobacteria bacterium P01_G01_bin.54]